MLYIIKFIYGFLLPPGLFVLLLVALSLWLWKRQRRTALMLLGVTALLFLLSTGWIGGVLISRLEQQYPQPDTLKGDIIVVLGGGATLGTPDINGEGNLFGSAANRLLAAARLNRTSDLPVLFSGGTVFPDSGNEADIAKRQLLALGMPEKAIIAENRSLNTEQNARYTSEILRSRGYSSVVLVTSAFHLPRAVLEFRKVGVNVQPYPVDYLTGSTGKLYPSSLSPSAGGLSLTSLALKEYLGILALKLRDH
ncbi:YdcF family protein [Paenibacillus sp. sgz500958]|uniref:YdcF family protein n=1 Tax=Paenibacillus sp. sgz500958 TaxID=3242475 RepID=UPI0036D2C1FE